MTGALAGRLGGRQVGRPKLHTNGLFAVGGGHGAAKWTEPGPRAREGNVVSVGGEAAAAALLHCTCKQTRSGQFICVGGAAPEHSCALVCRAASAARPAQWHHTRKTGPGRIFFLRVISRHSACVAKGSELFPSNAVCMARWMVHQSTRVDAKLDRARPPMAAAAPATLRGSRARYSACILARTSLAYH